MASGDSLMEENLMQEKSDSVKDENGDETKEEEEGTRNRIHVENIPTFFGHKAFRKLLDKQLGSSAVKKVKMMRDHAYVSLTENEDVAKAVATIDGYIIKKNTLKASLAGEAERKITDSPKPSNMQPKSAVETVTPLAGEPYDVQLKIKEKECQKVMKKLIQECYKAHVVGLHGVPIKEILNRIRPSPVLTEYRNKCEFTVGLDLEGNICTGFVGGRFSRNEHYVIPIFDCLNISTHMKTIVKEFTSFVIQSELAPFNEFSRVGTWKMLTIRELSCDVMLIVTVFPFEDKEKESEIKRQLIQRFVSLDTLSSRQFRVTSLIWQVQKHASDPVVYEHIAGAPYIYEKVLGVSFRVSPGAFFQTNSAAAAVLYSTIGEACFQPTRILRTKEQLQADEDREKEEMGKGNEEKMEESTEGESKEGQGVDGTKKEEDKNEEPSTKKSRVDEEGNEEPTGTQGDTTNGVEQKQEGSTEQPIVILDICCGTGTIGQCIMKNVDSDKKICCVGIELVESAVEDAKENARLNGLSPQQCSYVAGKAEDTFRSLSSYVPSGFSLNDSRVVGILDPPRKGLHEKVIIGCRQLSSMSRLVYVSCDPAAAAKNLVDLCRPSSKKFSGTPFRIEQITPVDMFPMTKHFEWVIVLSRQES